MKKLIPFFFLLLTPIAFSSCHSKNKVAITPYSKFQLEDSVVKTNTYNNNGFLDSTYSTSYHFYKDSLVMVIQSYITRKYDIKNQLILEQEYDNDEEGLEYTLSNQTKFEYDKKGRLTKETNLLGKTIFSEHGYVYNHFDSLSQEIYIVQNVPQSENTNMMADMMHHSGSISYDTMVRTYKYDASQKLIKSNTNTAITKTSIQLGVDEKLNIKIQNTKKDYYIDSTWTKKNILVKQVYMQEYPVCTCRTCTYYNKKGDEIKLLKYRFAKD